MILKQKLRVPTPDGENERFAYVYLPEAAKKEPSRRFPVLYMFDGHNVFYDADATYGKSWGLGEYLDAHKLPLIVAAVECNHDPRGARLSEYAPYDFSARGLGEIRGCGRQTMDWLTGVFKPMIDAHLPTKPERGHCFIAGSSMGGLMSLYAMAEYSAVFSRAAALSPSIDFGASKLDTMLRGAAFPPGTVLYLDYGENEMRGRRGMERRWRTVNRLLLQKGVLLTSRLVPGGEHCEASWEKQNPFFLSTLLYGLED